MAQMTPKQEREFLLHQYDALEDDIEDTALFAMWRLADWLADNVPNAQGNRTDLGARAPKLTLADLAERRGRSVRALSQMRQAAVGSRPDRIEGVSVRVYVKALEQAKGDLSKANAALRRRGTRLRDHADRMESRDALRQQAAKLPASERADLIADILTDDPEGLARVGDISYSAALSSAHAHVEAEREDRADERERVHMQLTEDEQRVRKIKTEMRHGNYGQAERILEAMDDPSIAHPALQEHRAHLAQIIDWLDAHLSNRAPDTIPEEWGA